MKVAPAFDYRPAHASRKWEGDANASRADELRRTSVSVWGLGGWPRRSV